MKRALCVLGAATVLVCLPAAATAQWFEDFDAYTPGIRLDNVGGWFGWDNASASAGTVSTAQARSLYNSIEVSNTAGDDAVHPFSGYSTGAWTFTAHQYVPANLDGLTYFILNNVYDTTTTPSTFEWAIEMHMDPATGMVNEQIRDAGGVNATRLIYDAWVEIRVEFDMDLDLCHAYYNNVEIAAGSWTTASYPTMGFANVDLYAPHAVSVHYDDMSLVPEPTSLLLLGLGALVLRRR